MNNKPATGRGVLGRWALIGLVALLMAFGPILPAFADSSYKVQPGDTLISIAARYGTTVDAIVAANALPSRSTIYAGQVLNIPSPGSNPAPAKPGPSSGQSTYTVAQGDTLSDIATRYSTTVDALMRANGLASTSIYAGQTLVIPAAGSSTPSQPPAPQSPPPAAQPSSGTYTVQAGDSIIALASRFGVTQQALASANGLQPFDRLFIGQVIKIPGASQSQQPPTQQPPTPTSAAIATAVPAPPVPATTTPQPVTSAQNAQAGKPAQYTVQTGDSLSSIAAKFNTTVDSLMSLNKLTDANFLRAGQVITVVKGDDQNNNPPITVPTQEPTPPIGQFGPKWVDVNLTTQNMIAFEGQTPVFSSKISSGIPRHPTVLGIYRIYAKYKATKMEGGQGTAEYYYLPNVPYTMYFYSGYALHGANWHNNFGQPMSHGCVNLPVDASKWMYDWAPIGTMVVTHR